jgi:membrane-associated phospholipid phosphatase
MNNLAKIFTFVFHPLFIAFYLGLLFVNILPFSQLYSFAGKFAIVGTIFLFTAAIPLIYMLLQYKNGTISDLNISDKTERTKSYFNTILSYLCCFAALNWLFGINRFFLLLFSLAVLSIIFLTTINFRWKISAHACGVGMLCGAVFMGALYLKTNPLWLFVLVVLISGAVCSSRLLLDAHTPKQVAAGFFMGLGFMLLPLV